MPSDQLYKTAQLYGAARLNVFSRQFAEAQEQLKMQEMVLIGLKQGYLNAQQKLAQAHECYEQLTSQPLLVRTQTLFIEANNLQQATGSEDNALRCLLYFYMVCRLPAVSASPQCLSSYHHVLFTPILLNFSDRGFEVQVDILFDRYWEGLSTNPKSVIYISPLPTT